MAMLCIEEGHILDQKAAGVCNSSLLQAKPDAFEKTPDETQIAAHAASPWGQSQKWSTATIETTKIKVYAIQARTKGLSVPARTKVSLDSRGSCRQPAVRKTIRRSNAYQSCKWQRDNALRMMGALFGHARERGKNA